MVERAVGRYALRIGNSNYEYMNLIHNADDDSRRMAEVLRKVDFQAREIIDGDRDEMLDAIDAFAGDLNEGDLGVVFFAGHGFQLDGVNYLVPVDVKEQTKRRVGFDNISVDYVLRVLEERRVGVGLVILDSCRTTPGDLRGEAAITQSDTVYSEDQPPVGVMIAYATSPGMPAYSGTAQELSSIYTRHLLKKVGEIGLTVYDVFSLVRVAVWEESGRKQRPWEAVSLTGGFMFKPSQEMLDEEKETWRLALASGDVSDVKTFLQLHPTSRFAASARRWLEDSVKDVSSLDIPAASEAIQWQGTVVTSGVRIADRSYDRPLVFVSQDTPVYLRPSFSYTAVGTAKIGESVKLMEPPNASTWALVRHPELGQVYLPGVSVDEKSVVEVARLSVALPASRESAVLTAAGPYPTSGYAANVRSFLSANRGTDRAVEIRVTSLGDSSADRNRQIAFLRALELKNYLRSMGAAKRISIVLQQPGVTTKTAIQMSNLNLTSASDEVPGAFVEVRLLDLQ
jgi:hypothetical protein